MHEEYITNSSEETKELGKRFAERLKMGDFVALYGDLGKALG
jgi:tRNA A37 threonylcarbamoyladenosine biosynthesis protein TsaE